MVMPDYGLSYSSSNATAEVISAEKYAEMFLKQQISDSNYTYELSAAQLWAIREDSSFHLLDVHPDVYSIFENDFDLSLYLGIIVHTTGWAAPLNDDGSISSAPSKHESRRRVSLAACVTASSVGSALAFPDQEELVLDPGSATGSLAEVLLTFWENNQFN